MMLPMVPSSASLSLDIFFQSGKMMDLLLAMLKMCEDLLSSDSFSIPWESNH